MAGICHIAECRGLSRRDLLRSIICLRTKSLMLLHSRLGGPPVVQPHLCEAILQEMLAETMSK